MLLSSYPNALQSGSMWIQDWREENVLYSWLPTREGFRSPDALSGREFDVIRRRTSRVCARRTPIALCGTAVPH